MLGHQTVGRTSTREELQEIEVQCPLNAHTKVVLHIGPRFIKPVEDHVPTNPGEVHDDEEDKFEDEEIANESPIYVGEPILPGPNDE